MYAVQQALIISASARDQLIASSLAQEGVEYVRAMRDGNYLYVLKTGGARSWLYGLDGSGGTTDCMSAACVVDPTQNTQSRSIGPLSVSATGLYNQAGNGTQTIFTRTVRLATVPGVSSEKEVLVTVQVTWSSRGQARDVTVTDYLTNWL
jgi:hypothetical protein